MTLDDETWLAAFATAWQGTRYANRGAVPGPRGGIGCVAYALKGLEAMGHAPGVGLEDLPDYTDDWSQTGQLSIVDTWLEDLGYLLGRALKAVWSGI